ncbi:DUF4926 domain-containing protein [bacterium]|nr:DUF4926 domain-containing protein [bacterium]
MLKELDSIVLLDDLTDHGLKRGDLGVIVLTHGDNEGYEIEFTTLCGETIAVVTLLPSQIRPVARREIAHSRMLA